LELEVGNIFDFIGEHEICRKYVAKRNTVGTQKIKGRQPRLEDKIVEGQFRFHFDTENLRRNIHKINPDDWISVTDKWHGTSVVISNPLVKRDLKWYERALKKLGVKIQEESYGLTYSSRRVIKEVNGETKANLHFYKEDIWGIVAHKVKEVLPKGYTVYGEIVGYTPEGKAIQKGYHYGCPVGGHRFLVYRVTVTNSDGKILELSWPQLKDFCIKYGLESVKEYYYGQAAYLFEDLPTNQHWNENFLEELEGEFILDQMCQYNNNEVPAEGIVVRVDKLEQCEAYKLKNFKFLEWETKMIDKGEEDIEATEVEYQEE
jgi:hypothetical protein